MPVQIGGMEYYTSNEVSEQLGVCRQTLWRWRDQRKVPAGVRYRTRQVLFTGEEVEAIRAYAEKIEPIELGGIRQLGLFPKGTK
jgi:transposase-like protein